MCSSPFLTYIDLLTWIVFVENSMSFHVRARASPSLRPVKNRTVNSNFILYSSLLNSVKKCLNSFTVQKFNFTFSMGNFSVILRDVPCKIPFLIQHPEFSLVKL